MSSEHYDINRHPTKNAVSHNQINTLINWKEIEKMMNSYYHKYKDVESPPAYGNILLFKMLLIGI